jgi:hypothetical protein
LKLCIYIRINVTWNFSNVYFYILVSFTYDCVSIVGESVCCVCVCVWIENNKLLKILYILFTYTNYVIYSIFPCEIKVVSCYFFTCYLKTTVYGVYLNIIFYQQSLKNYFFLQIQLHIYSFIQKTKKEGKKEKVKTKNFIFRLFLFRVSCLIVRYIVLVFCRCFTPYTYKTTNLFCLASRPYLPLPTSFSFSFFFRCQMSLKIREKIRKVSMIN